MKNKEKLLSDIIIEQIVEMIDSNIRIYYNRSDKYFNELRSYCNKNFDEEYKELDQQLLSNFTQSVLIDLLDCPFLYDFRALEF